jgi:hypothetical protein
MVEGTRSPAQYAADVEAARDRLIAFVRGCSDEQWQSAPLAGDPQIAIRHADDHRSDIETALAGPATG